MSITGPFSLSRRITDTAYSDPAELIRALARQLNAEARELAAAGATLLQIVEPFLADYPDQIDLAVEAAREKLATTVAATAQIRAELGSGS